MPRLSVSRLVPVGTALMILTLLMNVASLVDGLAGGPLPMPASSGLLNRAMAAPSALPAPTDGTGGDERCHRLGACQGTRGATTSAATHALMSDIEAERRDLATRAEALDARKRLLDAEALALDRRNAASRNPETDHAATLSHEDVTRLTAIYQAMKPQDAAAIFDILDLRVCVLLLQQMTPRRASAIMEVMSPQRAILATQMIAGRTASLVPVAHGG